MASPQRAALPIGLAALLTGLLVAPVPAPAQTPLPEDRPFTGDPGGDPPPPPARPRVRRREAPPRDGSRPKARPQPGPTGARDLINPPGRNILSVNLGLRAGLTRHSTGGFDLELGWSYRLTRLFWFDLLGGFGVGGACQVVAVDPQNRSIDSDCGGVRGMGVDLLAGVQVKFVTVRHWKLPIVPFARLAAGVAFIIGKTPQDGAAFVIRAGGGARYHIKPWVSVGAELAFKLGPAYRSGLAPGFFGVLELLVGVEFLL